MFSEADFISLQQRVLQLTQELTLLKGNVPTSQQTASPTTIYGSQLAAVVRTPVCNLITPPRTIANSAVAGQEGDITWDNNFIYVRSGNSWRRVAIATF